MTALEPSSSPTKEKACPFQDQTHGLHIELNAPNDLNIPSTLEYFQAEMTSHNDHSMPISNTTSTDRYFPSLPLELRLMIWELTLTPRVIPLICERAYYEDFVGVDRFVSTPEGPEALEFAIADNDIPIVSALYICQESRRVALNRGYRPWKLYNLSNEIKLVMWNPAIDTVYFGDSFAPDGLLRVMSQRYPIETQQLRHMALPTKHWGSANNGVQVERVDYWMQFENLEDLCVVIDLPYEYQKAVYAKLPSQEFPGLNPHPWTIPFDIEADFEEFYQREVPEFKIPILRVVEDEEDILSGQSMEMVLRCHPCEDMHYLLRTKNARELIASVRDMGTMTIHN